MIIASRRPAGPLVALAVVISVLAGAASCGGSPPAAKPSSAGEANSERNPGLFTEITERVGLDPAPARYPDGTNFLPEVTGPGVALLDYDNDSRLDILQVRMPPPGRVKDPAPNRLYQQQPDGTFRDVTERAGIGDPGYGQGVAVGDVDGDGDLDLYFSNYGPDAFYLNNGDGTFREATRAAGFSGAYWSSSAAFCDVDRDGDLDLYVAHYVNYRPSAFCVTPSGQQEYCGPSNFVGAPDTLYLNNGNGTFIDGSKRSGIVYPDGGRRAKGLGVICADLTDDGWPDIFVANDGEPNQLWVNQGDGTFREEGMLRGVAVNRYGAPEAGMGVALGDVDGDGRPDLFVTHLRNENNTLYRALGAGLFTDWSVEAGMTEADLAFTGFGTGFFDYDNDGDLDLAVVNGRVKRGPVLPGARLSAFWNQYAEPNLLFENDGSGHFTDVSARAGTFASGVHVHMGLAFGDIDADGDLDMVVSNNDNSIHLFRNDAPKQGRRWLLVRAVTGRRDAIGARVTVSAGGRKHVGIVMPARSFMSSSDPRVHFGLGAVDRIDEVEVLWPSGRRETFPGGTPSREMVLTEGSGEPR